MQPNSLQSVTTHSEPYSITSVPTPVSISHSLIFLLYLKLPGGESSYPSS
jgi:hypothetical protein